MNTQGLPGRRFGLELGIAAALMGVLLLRRQHSAPGSVLLVAGGVLVLLALARPATLEPVATRWLTFAGALARITTPVLLALLYFLLVTPMGYLRRTFGKSPLARDRSANSYWTTRPARTDEAQRARMERQF